MCPRRRRRCFFLSFGPFAVDDKVDGWMWKNASCVCHNREHNALFNTKKCEGEICVHYGLIRATSDGTLYSRRCVEISPITIWGIPSNTGWRNLLQYIRRNDIDILTSSSRRRVLPRHTYNTHAWYVCVCTSLKLPLRGQLKRSSSSNP